MGNLMATEDQSDGTDKDNQGASYHGLRRNSGKVKVDTTGLVKLFEKLESTATGEDKSDDSTHLSKTTFENAFEGPLERFGQLLFLQLVHGHTEKERLSQHHFVKSGKEVLRLNEESLKKYYFALFSASKDHLTKAEALEMVKCCYTLTLTASKIQPPTGDEDIVFESLVNSMFGSQSTLTLEALSTWMSWNSPHLYTGTHTWLLSVLQGARMPSELDIADVPHLDCIKQGTQLITMPMCGPSLHRFLHVTCNRKIKPPPLAPYSRKINPPPPAPVSTWLNTYLLVWYSHNTTVQQEDQTPTPSSSNHLVNTYLFGLISGIHITPQYSRKIKPPPPAPVSTWYSHNTTVQQEKSNPHPSSCNHLLNTYLLVSYQVFTSHHSTAEKSKPPPQLLYHLLNTYLLVSYQVFTSHHSTAGRSNLHPSSNNHLLEYLPPGLLSGIHITPQYSRKIKPPPLAPVTTWYSHHTTVQQEDQTPTPSSNNQPPAEHLPPGLLSGIHITPQYSRKIKPPPLAPVTTWYSHNTTVQQEDQTPTPSSSNHLLNPCLLVCTAGRSNPTPSSCNHLLNTYLLVSYQAHLSQFQSWSLLYSSNDHGLSANRFSYHVTSYHGPSVMLIAFEGNHVYCVASDTEWREDGSVFGGADCQLIQVSPSYRVIQVGAGLFLWNEKSRDKRRGIQIGKDSKTPPIFIPRDFDTVQHYGVDCRLHSIEVWSVGNQATKLAQMKQKQWEKKEVEKSRQQKLRLDPNWEENPDKAILEWGGIHTSHARR
ncbi:uncharacterized protein LOC135476446 [Liolophura sinensis]|uniref:uncharacterized protein LOC135476446 n=1 Tax=Liolophura sinensis TaxID=3198878 RepID=UPI00315948DE